MVTCIGYKIRKNKSGEEFIALELSGSLELVQSTSTGKFYATVRKCSIPSTFNEDVAKLMVGSQVEGDIVRVPCKPYDYVVKRTAEVVSLAYTYSYQPKGSTELIGEGVINLDEEPVVPAPKKNGKKAVA